MNSKHETMDHSVCLYITMVSFHQFSAWDHEPLYLYITTPWSLLTNFLHETMDPFLCLNTIASSHQCHAQDQWALHHGLFSPIPYMRSWSTLSVYTTSWSLLTNPIHENRDHYICLYITMVSSPQFYTRDRGPLSVCNIMVSSRQFHTPRSWTTLSVYTTWDHGPLHGLFSLIPHMRKGITLSVYITPWSLLNNSIHETRDHSICLYNSMVSSHQFVTWGKGPFYLSEQHHGLFSPIPYMRPGTALSLNYNTHQGLLTNEHLWHVLSGLFFHTCHLLYNDFTDVG